jgi:hypothetical protein
VGALSKVCWAKNQSESSLLVKASIFRKFLPEHGLQRVPWNFIRRELPKKSSIWFDIIKKQEDSTSLASLIPNSRGNMRMCINCSRQPDANSKQLTNFEIVIPDHC